MKLKVENLAKIKEAEVDVKNLTLFIGQNSTNKSYMAHVIYEMLDILNSFENREKNDNSNILSRVFHDYKNLLNNIVSKKYIQENNSAYTHIIFEFKDKKFNNDFLNKLYNQVLEQLIENINNSFYSKFNILKNLEISFNKMDIFYNNQYELRIYEEIDKIEDNLIIYMLLDNILNSIKRSLKQVMSNYYDIQYFPASRSGFMLAFDEIVSGLIRDKYRGQTSSAKLTKPTIDFITKYSDIKTQQFDVKNLFGASFKLNKQRDNEKLSNELIDFLEKNLIKGRIKEYKSDENYRNYYLEIGANTKLDLHIVSSSTLEILPFIVFLKENTNIQNSFFVIEEPEAHLHPKAQIQMARFIVMLVNSGAKVLVTTHSDYILGEINNCIKKYELQEDGISISQDDVSAYLFKNMENETVVKELDIDKFGVSDENFEEALDELLEESGNLTDRILENE